MRVLFLTLIDFQRFDEHNLYCDLLREFIANGNDVYCISPSEKRNGVETHLEENGHLLKLKIGNTQKTGLIEKGISTLRIEPQYKAAIRKYFGNIRFDLILYSTPPITLLGAISYVKKRDHAVTYLLLKDIFPQNAVDLGMMPTNGPRGVLYRYFRNKERKLYAVSDLIGCMSRANVKYLLSHNPEIDPKQVAVSPNTIEPQPITPLTAQERGAIRAKYGLPCDRTVFVYGGNLGKPQGIPFLIECLRDQKVFSDRFFAIIGNGTEYETLRQYLDSERPKNVCLYPGIPKEDYDKLLTACDVGLIFLDSRFTIPNFPSRLLGYLQAGMPVVSCTDRNTDIGDVIEEGSFGFKSYSDDVESFAQAVQSACDCDREKLGAAARAYLLSHYTSKHSYEIIMNAVRG